MALAGLAAITSLAALLFLAWSLRDLRVSPDVIPLWSLGGLFGCVALTFVLRLQAFNTSHYAAFHLENILRSRLAQKAVQLAPGALQQMGSGAMAKVMLDDVKSLHIFVADSTPLYARAIVMPLATAVILFWLDWRLAIATLGVLALGSLILTLARQRSGEMAQRYHQAREQVSAAVKQLQARGAHYFTKRIDTTLRGGIGFEIDAMLEQLPLETVAVVVPAMPQSRRILVGGYSVIDSVALSRTDVARDVRTPVTESWVPGLLAAQTHHQVGHIALASVMKGEEQLQRDLQEQQQRGVRVIVVDAITVDDVDAIAGAVVALNWNVLAVDPGPFTERLAVRRGLMREARSSATASSGAENPRGSILVVAGSATPVTKKQLQHLIANDERVCHIPVDAELLVDRKNAAEIEVNRVVQHARQCVPAQQNAIFVFESALTGRLLNLQEEEQRFGLAHGQAAENINQGLGNIVREVLNCAAGEIKGLYMTGGDTMVNVLKELGATGIEMIDYVIPQTDMVRIIGGDYAGLICVGKGGLTGPEDIISTIVERIYKEAQL